MVLIKYVHLFQADCKTVEMYKWICSVTQN